MCLSCLPPCGRAPAVADRFGRGVAVHVVGQDVECMLASARRRRPYRTVATRLTQGQLTLGLDSPETGYKLILHTASQHRTCITP